MSALSDTSYSLPLRAVGHLWTHRMGFCPGRESFPLNDGRKRILTVMVIIERRPFLRLLLTHRPPAQLPGSHHNRVLPLRVFLRSSLPGLDYGL